MLNNGTFCIAGHNNTGTNERRKFKSAGRKLVWEVRLAYKILVRKYNRTEHVTIPRQRWLKNIQLYSRDQGGVSVVFGNAGPAWVFLSNIVISKVGGQT